MKAEPNMETEVRSTLDQLWELHKKGDSEELIKIFSADPDVTFIGTRSDSKQIGIENIRTHFKQTFDLTAKPTELKEVRYIQDYSFHSPIFVSTGQQLD